MDMSDLAQGKTGLIMGRHQTWLVFLKARSVLIPGLIFVGIAFFSIWQVD